MQIFSLSHTRSFSPKAFVSSAGFTLIELLISTAIIGIVSTIVLVKHTSFDGTVLLKSAAYEVGLALREAQIKSVSVSGSNDEFRYPYGVTFTPQSKTYTAFRYTDDASSPKYQAPEAEDVATVTFGRSMRIKDVCIVVSGTEDCTIPTRLDISFRRPEFKAIFYVGGYVIQPNVESARIKLESTSGGTSVFVVEVSPLGQISVSKE